MRRRQTYREQFRPLIAAAVREAKGRSRDARRVMRLRLRSYFQSITAYRVYLSEMREALRVWPAELPSTIETRRRRRRDAENQRLLTLPRRSVDHGNLDLRSLGVTPLDDLVPTPVPPLPSSRPLPFEEAAS